MKQKKPYPAYSIDDSLNNVVSVCEMTGLEPILPAGETDLENYASLAGVPAAENLLKKRQSKI